ncbi:hypothetical protein [Paenibacillus taiwanensis]|uniref:hypothetical protein n=1 Tax=Paenibacillus taiwanensis TaxID=401638 RepID=UPI000422D13F|nr:hypothetical protein [Paenibacillus taiwanensis]
MDPVTATIVAVVVMIIGMVFLLLIVTKKAYTHKWDTEERSDSSTSAIDARDRDPDHV